MKSQVFELNTFGTYKYVVVLSEYNKKILLSRHKERITWETQGGHIEKNETPFEAAKRELFEESGAIDFDIEPLCDYRAWDEATGRGANGIVYRAIIKELGKLPDSEMAEVKVFNVLPDNLTYPAITPVLFNFLKTRQKAVNSHKMKLKSTPFQKIKSGMKTIELRLYDEKRQNIQVGDYIEFTLIDDSSQRIITQVTALHHFSSFQELYSKIPKEKLGYSTDEITDINHMDNYYSREEQKKYGALGIELCLRSYKQTI